jgi:hypothetical protein
MSGSASFATPSSDSQAKRMARGTLRDGAMSASGGRISYGTVGLGPSGILAREEPQSTHG